MNKQKPKDRRMTDEKLNEAIHAYMGNCCHDWSDTETYTNDDGTTGELEKCIHCGAYEASETDWRIPDYCNDHHAVREFLERVEMEIADGHKMWMRYVELYIPMTWKFVGASDGEMYGRCGVWLESRELAEAGAKAVGIWSDDEE